MPTPTWRDTTIYFQSDTGQREPETWEISEPPLTLTVTRHNDYGPRAWLLICPAADLNLHRLRAREIEAAKKEALAVVSARLQALLDAVNKLRAE